MSMQLWHVTVPGDAWFNVIVRAASADRAYELARAEAANYFESADGSQPALHAEQLEQDGPETVVREFIG